MSKNKTEKERNVVSELFLSDNDFDKNIYDDPDYIVYDEFEVAELIIIPVEEDVLKRHAKRKRKDVLKPYTDPSDLRVAVEAVAGVLCSLGEKSSVIVRSVLASVFVFIKIPVVFLWQKVIIVIADSIKLKASRSIRKMKLHDYKTFHKDARKTIKNLREKDSFRERRDVLKNNISLSFTKHRRVWLTAVNTIFPILCLIVLIVTASHYGKLTYALKVNYNGNFIGYISSEEVFNTAKDNALEKLSSGDISNVEISSPTYSIAMLTPNKLSDPKKICDKIIENTEGNFVNACGIYIDGEFVCAVKNETDAINVFDKILEPYEKKAGKDATVAFVQEIKYVQGFYTEDSVWDSGKLEEEMNASKSGAVYYKVKTGDTPISIAKSNNITYSDLIKLNPSLESGDIHVGEKVLISAQINNIRVKVMKTETRKVEIPYESETKESASLYKGTLKTVQKGQKGQQKITEIVTYIDGVKTYATTVSTVTTKYPVKEIIYKGTKEIIQTPVSSGGSYTGGYSNYISGDPTATGTSFGSPMASSYYYSSSYGGRTLYGRYNFHRGVDLCHAGGSSGIPVLSVASGTVVGVTQSYSGYGYSVLIRHTNGLQTRYAHMQAGSISVRVGQSVSKGQQIGRVGSTGNATGAHLHFEVIKNGVNVNPASYLH